MIGVADCLFDQQDWRLALLAALVCAFACFTTTALLARAVANEHPVGWLWLAAAAAMLGLGVWTLHFVSMLALMPTMQIAYAVRGVTWSVAIAVAGMELAFVLHRASRSPLLGEGVAGIIIGFSIFGMHWAGFNAMRTAAPFRVDAGEVALSVACGVVLATLALHRARDMAGLVSRLEVSCLLALAICSLHFLGMAALHPGYAPAGAEVAIEGDGEIIASRKLAVVVGCTGLLILVASLVASLLDQWRSERAVHELHRVRLLNNLSRETLIIARDNRIVEINAAGRTLFGRPAADLIGQDPAALFVDESSPGAAGAREGAHEVEIVGSDGRPVPVELWSREIDFDGRPASLLVLADVSDRRRVEKRIRHLAHHDPLTDLPNRVLLGERLAALIARAARTGDTVALFYLDLDRFKPVNDMHGHAVGDALLTEVARRLRRGAQDADTLARIGGDEFIALASVEHEGAAASLAARLVDLVRRPYGVLGRLIEIGVSIGVALYPRDGKEADILMQAADRALYRAKDLGGTFCFCSPEMDRMTGWRPSGDGNLDEAIRRGELGLVYQPIVNVRTGELAGSKAVLRWRHQSLGPVDRSGDVPLPDRAGISASLGRWMLETACREAAGWQQPWRLVLEVPAMQFRDCGFADAVIDSLASGGLAPGRLEIEINESLMIEDETRSLEVLGTLRRRGVGVALLGLGTGLSSMNLLRHFAFDSLVIDGALVSGLEHDVGATIIVRAMIGLARNFGLGTLADGIETVQQLDLLGRDECDEVRGGFFGPPLQLRALTDGDALRWNADLFVPAGHASPAALPRIGPHVPKRRT